MADDEEECGQVWLALFIGGCVSVLLWALIIATLVSLWRK